MLLVAASQLKAIFFMWILPAVLVSVLASRRVSKDSPVRIKAMFFGVLGMLVAFAMLVYADKQDLLKLSLWGTGAILMLATGVSIWAFSAVRKRVASKNFDADVATR